MNNNGGSSGILCYFGHFNSVDRTAAPPGTDLYGYGQPCRLNNGRYDAAREQGIFHQHGSGAGFNYLFHRTSHVDIDQGGIFPGNHCGGPGHDTWVGPEQLDAQRTILRGCFQIFKGLRRVANQAVGADHFGKAQRAAESAGNQPK
jgi:hypothetical protein